MKTVFLLVGGFLALAGLTASIGQQPGQATATAQTNAKIHSHHFNISTSTETIPELLAKTTGNLIVWGTHVSEGMGSDPNAPAYPPEKLAQMACVSDAAIVGTAGASRS